MAKSSWKSKVHFVTFSYDEEQGIRDWFRGRQSSLELDLLEVVDSGWAIKITPPQDGELWWVSMTGKTVEKDLRDHTFTVKYPGLDEAVALLIYTLQVKLQDKGWRPASFEDERSWLGE